VAVVQGNPVGGNGAVVTPLQAIEDAVKVGAVGVYARPLCCVFVLQVHHYHPHVLDVQDTSTTVTYQQGCWIVGEGTWQFPAALQAARAADVVIVMVGSSSKGTNISQPELLNVATEKESLDRTTLLLPGVQVGCRVGAGVGAMPTPSPLCSPPLATTPSPLSLSSASPPILNNPLASPRFPSHRA
jgi:hypothetical protein